MALGTFQLSGIFLPQSSWTGTWTEEGVVTVKPNNFRYTLSYDDALTHPASWLIVEPPPGFATANIHPAHQGSFVSVLAVTQTTSAPSSAEPLPMPAVSEWRGSFAVVQPNGKSKSYSDKFLLTVLPVQSDSCTIKIDGRGGTHLGAYNLRGEFSLLTQILSMDKVYTGIAKQRSPNRPRYKTKDRTSGYERFSMQQLSRTPASDEQPRGVRERKRTIVFEAERTAASNGIVHVQVANQVPHSSADVLSCTGVVSAGNLNDNASRKRKVKQPEHEDYAEDASTDAPSGKLRPSQDHDDVAETAGCPGVKRRRAPAENGASGRQNVSAADVTDDGSNDDDTDGSSTWSETAALGFLRRISRQMCAEEQYAHPTFDEDEETWLHDVLTSVFDDPSAEYHAVTDVQHRQRWISLCGLEPRVAGFLTKRRRKAEHAFRTLLAADGGVYPVDLQERASTNSGTSFQSAAHLPPEAGSSAGELYEGEALGRVPHGYGSCITKNGLMYEGTWFHGKEYGWGILSDTDDNILYEGEFSDGDFNGVGLFRYPCGDIYIGGWRSGLPHGRGMYMSPDLAFYDGEWADGLRHGQGINYVSGCSSYTGQWRFGQKHGRGELVAAASSRPGPGRLTISIDQKTASLLHESSQTRNITMLYSTEPTVATHYRGVWALDSMDGRADIFYAQGVSTAMLVSPLSIPTAPGTERYEGNCKDGRRDGRGTYTFTDGQALSGKWRGDVLDDKELSQPSVSAAGDGSLVAERAQQSTTFQGTASTRDRAYFDMIDGMSTDAECRSPSDEVSDKDLEGSASEAGVPAAAGSLSIPKPVSINESEYLIPLHTGDLHYVHRAAGFSATGQ